MQFQGSSHALNWIFTREKLEQQRLKAHQSAYFNQSPRSGDQDIETQDMLTLEEEALIIQMNEKQLLDLCDYLKAPEAVTYTALTFLRRYYLMHTVVNHDPSEIVVSCILIGSKVEENRDITALKLHQTVKGLALSRLLQMELILLPALKFDLQVFLPFQPLYGFILDMKDRVPNSDPTYYSVLYTNAHAKLASVMRSNAIFLYSPSQLALAGLIYASRTFENGKYQQGVQRYCELSNFSSLMDIIESSGCLASMDYIPDVIDPKHRKEVTKKLKLLRNPLFDPKSGEYQQQQQQIVEDKRQKNEAKLSLMNQESGRIRKEMGIIELTSQE